ncbi:hypothetical protein ScPMuIL_012269 [Solemya velum]
MGRRPRNLLPSSEDVLKPAADNTRRVKQHFDHQKQRQKFYHDHKKGVKELPIIKPGTPVAIKHPDLKPWVQGTVINRHEKPRSYVVSDGRHLYRRNRRHIRQSPERLGNSSPEVNRRLLIHKDDRILQHSADRI